MDLNALQVVEDVPAASKRIRSRKFRICMKKLLSLPVVDHAARDELLALGVDGNDADNYMLITLAVFKKAAGGDLMNSLARSVLTRSDAEMRQRYYTPLRRYSSTRPPGPKPRRRKEKSSPLLTVCGKWDKIRLFMRE